MNNYITLFLIFSITAVFSFVNQMVYANYFGASAEFDMLNAVLALPYAIIGIGSGAISLIVMPILNEAKEKYGTCSNTLLSLIKSYYIHIGLIAIFIVILQMLMLYNQVSAEQQTQFIKLSILSGIFLFISFLNSFFIVYYNLKKKFILASINAMIIYITSIILCYGFAKTTGVDIVVYSFIVSNLLLFLLFVYNFSSHYDKNNIHKTIKLKIEKKVFFAGIVSIFPFTFPVFIDSYFLLSMSAGSLSYVAYANKIVVMLASILIQPLNLILFPHILSSVSSENFAYIKKMLFKIYILVLISVVVIYIVSKIFFLDFMHLFFENGSFLGGDSKMVYQVFLIYLIGTVGMTAMNIQNRVLSALKAYKAQTYSSVLFISMYIYVISIKYQSEGFMSSGYAYSIAWSLYSIGIAIILHISLEKRKKV